MIQARRAEFRAEGRNRGGEISFLALHSLTVTFLPGWLMRLKSAAGQMTSRVKPENFDRCVEAMAEGGHDFFLTYAHPQVNIPLDPAGYPHLVVGHDSLVAVARPGWPREWLTEGIPMLKYSRGSFLNAMARIALAQPGAPAVYVAHTDEASMAEAMKSMAVAGHGMVWIPRLLVEAELETNRLEIVAPNCRWRSGFTAMPRADAASPAGSGRRCARSAYRARDARRPTRSIQPWADSPPRETAPPRTVAFKFPLHPVGFRDNRGFSGVARMAAVC